MAIPELLRKTVENKLSRYCQSKIPPEAKGQIKLSWEIRGNHVTLIESRPYFLDPNEWTKAKVAQFRFDPQGKTWSLFCRDRNGRWHLYNHAKPASNLEPLINALDSDITGIFWG